MKDIKMSSFITFYLSYFTLVTISISLFYPLSSASSPSRPFHKVYVFGDSYTDTGNTNSTTGPNIFRHVSELPYGRTFFRRPTNRYSDGRLLIDFIAESLNLPFFPPYLNKSSDTTHGVNFAVSGCAAIPYPFFLNNNLTNNVVPQSLLTQLTWFKQFIKNTGCNDAVSTPPECKTLFADSLIWVGEIAANDYNYIIGTNVTSRTVQKLAIKTQTKFLKSLLKMGAKYMVVQGLQATGCLPLAHLFAPATDRDEMGCVASKNQESYNHNVILQKKLRNLRKEFPEAVIVYSDDWGAYREAYRNSEKYGFRERFRACCGAGGGEYNFIPSPMMTCGAPGTSSCERPSEYMNWDGLHVTESLNRVVSKMLLDGAFAQPPFSYLLKKKAESRG